MPDARVLTFIYNLCLKFRKIECLWKSTETILNYKKSEHNSFSNWRSIAISITIYKLYVGLLVKKLSKWVVDNEILSHNQKVFLPYDGVYENSYYVIDLTFRSAKGSRSNWIIAALDLSNVFGLILHWGNP